MNGVKVILSYIFMFQFLTQYFLEVLYKRSNFASLVCLGVDSPIHLQASSLPPKVSPKNWNSKNIGNTTSAGNGKEIGNPPLTVYAHPLLCQNAAKNLK